MKSDAWDDAKPPRVEDAVLEDLRSRLLGWRPVESTGVPGWRRGADGAWLADVVRYWASD